MQGIQLSALLLTSAEFSMCIQDTIYIVTDFPHVFKVVVYTCSRPACIVCLPFKKLLCNFLLASGNLNFLTCCGVVEISI